MRGLNQGSHTCLLRVPCLSDSQAHSPPTHSGNNSMCRIDAEVHNEQLVSGQEQRIAMPGQLCLAMSLSIRFGEMCEARAGRHACQRRDSDIASFATASRILALFETRRTCDECCFRDSTSMFLTRGPTGPFLQFPMFFSYLGHLPNTPSEIRTALNPESVERSWGFFIICELAVDGHSWSRGRTTGPYA